MELGAHGSSYRYPRGIPRAFVLLLTAAALFGCGGGDGKGPGNPSSPEGRGGLEPGGTTPRGGTRAPGTCELGDSNGIDGPVQGITGMTGQEKQALARIVSHAGDVDQGPVSRRPKLRVTIWKGTATCVRDLALLHSIAWLAVREPGLSSDVLGQVVDAMPQLRTLEISRSDLGSKGFAHLQRLRGLEELQYIPRTSPTEIRHIVEVSQVKRLTLGGGSGGFYYGDIGTIVKKMSLHELQLVGSSAGLAATALDSRRPVTRSSREGQASPGAARTRPTTPGRSAGTCETGDASKVEAPAQGVTAMTGEERKALARIVSGGGVVDHGPVSRRPKLRVIIWRDGATCVADLALLRSVTWLAIRDPGVSSKVLGQIVDAMPQLRTLEISQWCDPHCKPFSHLRRLRRLEELEYMPYCWLIGLDQIVELSQLKRLTLGGSEGHFYDGDTAAILRKMPQLEALKLVPTWDYDYPTCNRD